VTWLAIKLFAGGLLKRLWEAATALWGVASRHPWQAALIVAVLAAGWQWRGKQHAMADLAAEKIAHAASIKQYQDASAKAKADQTALFAENQALSQRIAENAISNHRVNIAATDRALADYATAHGLRKACSGISAPGIAPVPADPGAPDSPSPDADMVAVTRPDLDALAKAAVQGREATSFLIEQVNAGLAVEWPEPRQ
jgi:hypothetical protein